MGMQNSPFSPDSLRILTSFLESNEDSNYFVYSWVRYGALRRMVTHVTPRPQGFSIALKGLCTSMHILPSLTCRNRRQQRHLPQRVHWRGYTERTRHSRPCEAKETAKMKRVRYQGVPWPLKKTSINCDAPCGPDRSSAKFAPSSRMCKGSKEPVSITNFNCTLVLLDVPNSLQVSHWNQCRKTVLHSWRQIYCVHKSNYADCNCWSNCIVNILKLHGILFHLTNRVHISLESP